MKLVYIANCRIPTEKAHGFQIMKMSEAFTQAGHEVELITAQRFNWIKEDPFDYYQIERTFKIKKLPCLDLVPLVKYIGHLGLWVEVITFLFFAFPYLLFKKADIFYIRDKLLLPFVFLKKNLIFEAHSFPRNYFLYAPFLKRLKGVVVVTQKLKELFVKQGIISDKILVAPDGVDLKIFDLDLEKEEARKKLNLPLDKKIIGYCGRFKTMGMEKGIDDIFQALVSLEKEVIFLGIGISQDELNYYQKKAKNLGIKERVILIERISQKLLAQYQKACDVLIMPLPFTKHYAYYASPLKMFEYMASKRPIVATDLPSLREILNERNAILVKPENLEELKEGIKKALYNFDLAKSISEQAYRDVQNFSWEKRVKKIINFIISK